MRPIGFLQQGMAALWMQSAPWASHLISVLNHALVALTFVWVLRRAGLSSATAALAGVFFVLSPLTTMATGWISRVVRSTVRAVPAPGGRGDRAIACRWR